MGPFGLQLELLRTIGLDCQERLLGGDGEPVRRCVLGLFMSEIYSLLANFMHTGDEV